MGLKQHVLAVLEASAGAGLTVDAVAVGVADLMRDDIKQILKDLEKAGKVELINPSPLSKKMYAKRRGGRGV